MEAADFVASVTKRNASFVSEGFSPQLKIIPSSKTVIIGCLDPRVDPLDVLGLEPGETAIYRNIGGRINPALVETMVLLPIVTKAVANQDMGPGWNLVILHHTDCGIRGCYKHAPELLAKHLGVTPEALDRMEVMDPYKAVALDVAAWKAALDIDAGFLISGLVYDVATGGIEVVCPPELLRPN